MLLGFRIRRCKLASYLEFAAAGNFLAYISGHLGIRANFAVVGLEVWGRERVSRMVGPGLCVGYCREFAVSEEDLVLGMFWSLDFSVRGVDEGGRRVDYIGVYVNYIRMCMCVSDLMVIVYTMAPA